MTITLGSTVRVKALDKLGEGKLAATLAIGAESRTESTYITVRPATPPQTVAKKPAASRAKRCPLSTKP